MDNTHFDKEWEFDSPILPYTEEKLRKIFSKYFHDYVILKSRLGLPELLDLFIKEAWLWRWSLTNEEENFIRRAYGNLHKGNGSFMFDETT